MAVTIRRLTNLKDLRRRFEAFCYRNRYKGIRNLMLYICIGNAVVYLMTTMAGNALFYQLLCFDRTLILHGQVWRLITYPLTMYNSSILMMMISLLCYYSLGTIMERVWGTCKFNLFYLSGILMMDVYSMIFGGRANVYGLNTSLFLGYATMNPNAGFLLFFIIPVRAWIFAAFDLFIVFMDLFTLPFPDNFLPMIGLLNYFLFFGKDVINVVPLSVRIWFRRLLKKPVPQPKVIPFRPAETRQAPPPKPNYTHRCTVCGRTDVSDPDLEFRYCSRCRGYYCYCSEHISNHSHIQ